MTDANQPPELMFLEFSQWSPRFDKAFYTIKMDTKELRTSPPETTTTTTTTTPSIPPPGKDKYPAYYYLITVFRERETKVVYRRYSQFRWLFDAIKDYTPPLPPESLPQLEPIVMPPKTCPWQKIDEDFAQNRLEQLQEFLQSILIRPGIASHPAVLQFLELEESPSS